MRQQRQILAAATLTFVLGSAASQAGLGDLLQQGQKLLGNEPVQQHSTLDSETLGAGLKEALRVGSERAVDTLAQPDGYLGNADVRIELPLLGNVNLNLADHVTGEALDGLFLMLAREEKKIREQPLARTTDLLRQVFSN